MFRCLCGIRFRTFYGLYVHVRQRCPFVGSMIIRFRDRGVCPKCSARLNINHDNALLLHATRLIMNRGEGVDLEHAMIYLALVGPRRSIAKKLAIRLLKRLEERP